MVPSASHSEVGNPAPRGNYFACLPVRFPGDPWLALKSDAPEALRWFHPDDLHLTVAFFGRENPDRIPAVREVLAGVPCIGTTVTLGALRLLPRPRRFSALSFQIQAGHEEIAGLIAAWRGPLLEAAGRPPDVRPPLPHLTIARPARRHPDFRSGRIARWAAALTPPAAPISVQAPVLFGWSAERPRRQFRVLEDGSG